MGIRLPASAVYSDLADYLLEQINDTAIPQPIRDYKFHPKRRWKIDLAWPQFKTAVEVEGGTFKQGRHVRGRQFQKDCEKYNAAAAYGFYVLRFDTDMVQDGRAIQFLQRWFQAQVWALPTPETSENTE